MSNDEPGVTIARARSIVARQRLATTMVAIQARLNPKALARDAIHELRETGQELAREGVETMKRHPLTLGTAAAAVGIFLARKPLTRMIADPPPVTTNATPAKPKSLTTKAPRRGKRTKP